MKNSRRHERLHRHHKRNKYDVAINLVSLIDIFTVLVFFLLANFGDVTLLSEAKDLELPLSAAEQKSEPSLVVAVSRNEVLVAGKPVMTLAELEKSEDPIIPALRLALQQHIAADIAAGKPQPETTGKPRKITIFGDKGTPYRVLKRVMTTCGASDFGEVSLAVTPGGAPGQSATSR